MDNSTGSTSFAGRFRLGVRAKVVLILLVTLLVALSVNSLLALRAQKQDILKETERRGREATHFVANYLAYSVISFDYHALELTLQEIARRDDIDDIVYARVENTRGNIMAEAGTRPVDAGAAQEYGEDIALNGEILGRVYLTLSTERIIATLEARQRDTLLRQMLVILAVMAAGFAALSLLIIRPLTIFSRVIRDNLDTGGAALQRIPLASRDEFGDLARGFNALQDRLDDARHKLESRIDVANHELQGAYERLATQAEELRRMNRDLEQLSVTDPLTGLYNRRYFEKLMESEVALSIRNDETISILLLDLDRFREINERHGHNTGDDAIREVAQILAGQLRQTDVACRFGGDEFFVLCRRATIANAIAIADKLQHALTEQPLRIGDLALPVKASIGVATIPGVHQIADAAEFFHCADEALRHAKQRRHDAVVHFSMLDRSMKASAL